MNNFWPEYYKYLNNFVKQAEKVRTDRIPKGSIIAKGLAKEYWDNRIGWDGEPLDLTPTAIKNLNKETRDKINKAQYTNKDKKTVHNQQLQNIYRHYSQDAVGSVRDTIHDINRGYPVSQDEIDEKMQKAYDSMQRGNKALHNFTRRAYTAENTRQLLLPQTPKVVRKYIKDVPMSQGDSGQQAYNSNNFKTGETGAYYAYPEGRAHIGRKSNGGTGWAFGHEIFGHGVDAAYTNANEEQLKRYEEYNQAMKQDDDIVGNYNFNNDGKTITKSIPQGTMATEGIASTRPVQYMRQVLKTAPHRLANRLGKNYELQNNISYNSYNNTLKTGLPERIATEPSREEEIGKQIDRDINALAKINKISARKELSAVPADKAYNNNINKKSIVDKIIEDTRMPKEKATLYKGMFQKGFTTARKKRKDEDKVNKQNRINEIAARREDLKNRQEINRIKREKWQKEHPEAYKKQQSILNKKGYFNILRYIYS